MCRKIRDFAYWIESPKGDHVLERHRADVTCAVLSDDSRYLFTASFDACLIKWDLKTLKPILQWEPKEAPITCLALRKQLFVSGADGKIVSIWTVQHGRLVHTLKGHTESVMCVAFSHTGESVFSGAYDDTLREWSVETGKCLRILTHHTGVVLSVLPFQGCLLTRSKDESIALIDERTGSVTKSITDDITNSVSCIRINCDHSMVAACVSAHCVLIYSWPNMTQISLIDSAAKTCCFHPSNPNLLALGFFRDHTVKIFDVRNGDIIRELKGHSDTVEHICFTASHLISVSGDKSVRLWDISSLMI